MKRFAFVFSLALVAAMTILPGIVHGVLDGRWLVSDDLQRIAGRLPKLPEQVGPWVKVSDEELGEHAARILKCYGYLDRTYWNPSTGDQVHVAVLYGPRGPMAVHTPEICYSSAGTQPSGDRQQSSIVSDNIEDRLWRIQFKVPNEPTPSLEVWYAWSDGGPWQASEHPRFWMTDRLYKIQVACNVSGDGITFACKDFLAEFLPAVRAAIRKS